jgi:hypothetical protein
MTIEDAHEPMSDDGADARRELVEKFRAQLDEWDLWQANPTEAFEQMAARFYRDTGLLAPGKSLPLEASAIEDAAMRLQRYNEWVIEQRRARHLMLREIELKMAYNDMRPHMHGKKF